MQQVITNRARWNASGCWPSTGATNPTSFTLWPACVVALSGSVTSTDQSRRVKVDASAPANRSTSPESVVLVERCWAELALSVAGGTTSRASTMAAAAAPAPHRPAPPAPRDRNVQAIAVPTRPRPIITSVNVL